jgi:hypothetical protein
MKEFEQRALDAGLNYRTYPSTGLINVTDNFGVIQSYYTTTNTAVFRDSNNRYNQQRKTIRDMNYEEFIGLCKDPDEILDKYFLEDE